MADGGRRRRILVAVGDSIGSSVAGPGIRALQIASALAKEHDVRLVTTASITSPIEGAPFPVAAVDEAELCAAVEWCEVVIGQGWVLAGRRFVTRSDKIVVADLYDPMHLEQLEQARHGGDAVWWAAVSDTTAVINEQLLRGDLFLCANSRQRDLWLGALATLGRVNPATYADDPSLGSLLRVVPFGLPDEPPTRTGPGLRGVVPGIGAGDQVVLWGGGIYNWLDPLTVIAAVDMVRHDCPNVRLVFMGLKHPNPEVPEMHMAVEARRLADRLGLTGAHVFFNEGWVPYGERQNVLLDADIGVGAHLDHLETEFSFRTRMLDYLWAGLPIVTTQGDGFADLVTARGIGVSVPVADPPAMAAALREVLESDATARDGMRARTAAAAAELRWSRVLEPVIEFCRSPRRAPDLADGALRHRLRPRTALGPRTGWRADGRRAVTYFREGGALMVARRVTSRLRRTLGRDRGQWAAGG
jgi:glycosyltransferase involved in cell wall biosynthesis